MIKPKPLWAAGSLILLASMSSTPAQAQAAGDVFRDCADCPDMVAIPAGTFLMGSRPGPFSHPPADEQPRHAVTLESFALGKFEVTQAQWSAVMGTNPSVGGRGPTLPVEMVSWDDVRVFLRQLNAKTGKRYRLPTESEWEYAARAGNTGAYSFGDSVAELDRYAWFRGNSGNKTHPVGEKAANKFGLHDMHGNVWEWVEDCYHPSYEGAPADGSAAPELEGCDRVFRGGSWVSKLPDFLRSAYRYRFLPFIRLSYLGFRVARDLP
jgi:formylglycine-generating enzyme required for sulfatase activity